MTFTHEKTWLVIAITVIVLLTGCITTETSIKTTTHPATLRNPKCENIKAFKVFQVLDTFVLANINKDDDDDEYFMGHIVYFKKEKDIIYYDDQIIKVKDNECAVYVGTYQYQTAIGINKTVPIVKIISSEIQNPK